MLCDVPPPFRHRFSRGGHKVVFNSGSCYYLEDGSRGLSKDIKVDWDEALWREAGVWPRKGGKKKKRRNNNNNNKKKTTKMTKKKKKKAGKVAGLKKGGVQAKEREEETKSKDSPGPKLSEYYWTCISCTLRNPHTRSRCKVCTSPSSLGTASDSLVACRACYTEDDARERGLSWEVARRVMVCRVEGCEGKGQRGGFCRWHRPRSEIVGGRQGSKTREVAIEDVQGCDTAYDDVPLGTIVRKFFDGYGYFNGAVVDVRRCLVGGALQLAYRIAYEDGDSEDMLRWKVRGGGRSNILRSSPPRNHSSC